MHRLINENPINTLNQWVGTGYATGMKATLFAILNFVLYSYIHSAHSLNNVSEPVRTLLYTAFFV